MAYSTYTPIGVSCEDFLFPKSCSYQDQLSTSTTLSAGADLWVSGVAFIATTLRNRSSLRSPISRSAVRTGNATRTRSACLAMAANSSSCSKLKRNWVSLTRCPWITFTCRPSRRKVNLSQTDLSCPGQDVPSENWKLWPGLRVINVAPEASVWMFMQSSKRI